MPTEQEHADPGYDLEVLRRTRIAAGHDCPNCEQPYDRVAYRWRCPSCGWKDHCCDG